MLRSIYGQLPTESERFRSTARSIGRSSLTDATPPTVVFDSDAIRADHVRTTANTTAIADVADAVSAADNAVSDNRNPDLNQTQINVSKSEQNKSLVADVTPVESDRRAPAQSGVYLSEILRSIGLVNAKSRANAGLASQRSVSPASNVCKLFFSAGLQLFSDISYRRCYKNLLNMHLWKN